MPQHVGYVIGSFKRHQVLAEIESRRHPVTEYVLFLRRNPNARIFYYDDVAREDPQLFQALQSRHLPEWGMPRAVYSADPPLDAILATGEDVGLPLALDAQARKLQIPIYIITHGFVVRVRQLMKSVARMENVRFLCLSERVKEMLIKQFGVPESRVANTGYGVDTRFFSPTASSRLSPLIVSAGAANRDYRTLLKAVESLDADVKIAADSAWSPGSLNFQYERVPHNVEIRSYGNFVNLRRLYSEASFVVVPLHQTLSACGYTVIAEAMAMGKAVIATKTESYGDAVIEEETGYYVPPGNVEQLREKIDHLLSNPALAQEMGRRARRRMEGWFNLERYCERLEHALAVG